MSICLYKVIHREEHEYYKILLIATVLISKWSLLLVVFWFLKLYPDVNSSRQTLMLKPGVQTVFIQGMISFVLRNNVWFMDI